MFILNGPNFPEKVFCSCSEEVFIDLVVKNEGKQTFPSSSKLTSNDQTSIG